MSRPQATVVAILVVGGMLWAMTSLVPPSRDMAQSAFEQAKANGSAHFDADLYTVWSVPGMLGHVWTCKVHIDSVASPHFVADGFYECSPWPWADGSRRSPRSTIGQPLGG
jgi:hypothetical protein